MESSMSEKGIINDEQTKSQTQENNMTSIINLEVVNKNDKKLIKLNSNPSATNKSILIANYDITNSIDSLKTKISKILNEENVVKQQQQSDVVDKLGPESENRVINFVTLDMTSGSLEDDENDEEEQNKEYLFVEANESRANKAPSETLKGRKRAAAQLICSECGHEFYLLGDLNKHMMQVHGSRAESVEVPSNQNASSSNKYKCSMCDREFVALSSKSRHEREHAGLKPFPCHICAFEFSRMSNLRTHLLRVHPNDAGVLYRIYKAEDNVTRLDFDFDAIRQRREQQRALSIQQNSGQPYSFGNQQQTTPNNTIIYIRDPKNKNGDIQHMVVYVNGKPIFVQNANLKQQQQQQTSNEKITSSSYNHISNTSSLPTRVKIPYMEIQSNMSQNLDHRATLKNAVLEAKQLQKQQRNVAVDQDHEYLQLVSMFKQKNEKLFNPLN